MSNIFLMNCVKCFSLSRILHLFINMESKSMLKFNANEELILLVKQKCYIFDTCVGMTVIQRDFTEWPDCGISIIVLSTLVKSC